MRKSTLRQVPAYLFLTVAALASVFPLYFMVVSATNTSNEVLASKMTPGGNLLTNVQRLLELTNLYPALGYSAAIAVLTTLLALAVCSVAGYGFEVYHSRGKDTVMSILLLAMMIPFAATMIPLFQLFGKVGLVNSNLADRKSVV